MSYKIFFLLIQNNYLSNFTVSEVEKKALVEILTARYRSYFHKKFKGAYASQTFLLYLEVFYGELIDFQ